MKLSESNEATLQEFAPEDQERRPRSPEIPDSI